MRHLRPRQVVAMLVAGLVILPRHCEVPAVLAQVSPSFNPILNGTPPQTYACYPYALTSDGSRVAGTAWNAIDRAAFEWSAGQGLSSLEGLSPFLGRSEGLAISSDGKFIVGYWRDLEFGQTHAFRWQRGSGVSLLSLLPGATEAIAFDVSKDGDVVVGECAFGPSESEAFLWTPALGMKSLGDLPGAPRYSLAVGVSGDGQIVAGIGNYNPISNAAGQAFRWTEETGIVGLGYLPGYGASLANGISVDGEVIIGYGSNGGSSRQAFLWRSWSGIVGLGFLPNGWPNSSALSASFSGLIIVGVARNSFGQQEAFVFDEAYGMRSLREVLVNQCGLGLAGWRLISATAVSDDGSTIIGLGQNPDGMQQSWVAVLPPSGDFNEDGATNGQDLQPFCDAVQRGSVYRPNLVRGDFNRNMVLDPGDIPGMVAAVLRGAPLQN